MLDGLTLHPMVHADIDALEPVIRHAAVYRHLGGEPPDADTFRLELTRALAGPRERHGPQAWLNYVMRRDTDQAVVGRLEATVHDGIAEVAFLLGPAYWGQGYATQGLRWLIQQVLDRPDCHAVWATTIAPNLACQQLLRRCGFQATTTHWPRTLFTYDAGDLVFQGPTKG